MNRNMIIIAVVVVLLALGGFIFVSNSMNTQAPTATSTPESADQTLEITEDTSESTDSATDQSTAGVKEFTVTGSSFKFEPATLTVNQGDTVKITFKNSGGIHDFVIDGLDVATKQLSSGAEETVEFTADKAGTFEYYCSVGNHRQMGMKGRLTVI